MIGKILYKLKVFLRTVIPKESCLWKILLFLHWKIFKPTLKFLIYLELVVLHFSETKKFFKDNPTGTYDGFRLYLFGEKIVHEVFPIFKKLDMTAFLYGGTLLGYCREKDFIKHDDDLDIGIFEKDIKKVDLLKDELQQNGWIVKHQSSEGITFENPKYYYLNIDVYYFLDCGQTYQVMPKRYWKKNHLDKLILISFFGEEIYIPKRYRSHLTEVYGKDWMTPKKIVYEKRIEHLKLS